MQHGEGRAQQRGFNGGMPDMNGEVPQMPPEMDGLMQEMMAYQAALSRVDLNQLLAETDLNQLLAGKDLTQLLTGFSVRDLLSEEQIAEYFGDLDPDAMPNRGRMGGGMGMPRGLQSSADTATTDFVLTKNTTAFSNVVAAE